MGRSIWSGKVVFKKRDIEINKIPAIARWITIDSARMLAWASFAESMDGPSMELGTLIRVKPRLGSINKIKGSSIRLSKVLGLNSVGELQGIKNMSFKDFHMKFSGKYIGKFKGRGSYMSHMARDWKAIKAGL